MPQITVRVDGNVKVGKGLKALGAALPDLTNDELAEGLEQAAQEARGGWPAGGFTGYKVAPPRGTKYVRTGNLGKSTTWERAGQSWRIVSNAYTTKGKAYSRYVIGDGNGQGQASQNAHWPVMFKVAMKWAKTLIDNINNRIRRKAAEEGLGL